MASFNERLRFLRKERNLSQQELAKLLSTSKSSINMYERGEREPGLEMLEQIADFFNVDLDYLHGKSDCPNKSILLSRPLPDPVRIPIYSYIPAGIPMEAIEEIVDYEEVPASWIKGDKEFFGMKIKGDSMSPEYRDGDTVIFKKQSTCENGDDCAVMVNGNDATFKRVRREMGGIILQPLNPAYDPMSFSNEEIVSKPVRIIGVFWELRRSRH